MYRVKVYVDRSPIHGLGVYAAQDIKKGEVVWEHIPGFDQVYTQKQYDALPQQARDYLDIYAYWDKEGIHLCGDQGIYTNHSEEPNVGNWPNKDSHFEVAYRDIRKGEEITSDYRTFDDVSKRDLGQVIGASAKPAGGAKRMKKAA